jgi:S1-C subfamily serine protease
MATLIPVAVGDLCHPLRTVRASYADLIWGVPTEASPAHPFLGLSTMGDESSGHRKVIYVSSDSPAEEAAFQPGDLLLAMDGVELVGRAGLKRLIAGKQWGDRAVFTVERDAETLRLEVQFRRTRPEPCEDEQ